MPEQDKTRKRNIHQKNGDYAAAITDYTEGIRLIPEYADAYHSRGEIQELIGNWAEAKADFRMAKELGYKP